MRDNSSFRDILLESPDGGLLFALINGDVGWLMYLREPGDAGFSSRNPDCKCPADEKIKFRLSNGQVDEYPRAWTYPSDTIERALEHFRNTGMPPEFIQWHNDSGDGEPIVPREPRHPGKSGQSR